MNNASNTRGLVRLWNRALVLLVILGCVTTTDCSKGLEPNAPPDPPSNPVPPDNGTAPTDADLSWTCTDPDQDPLRFDVYFGTSSPPSLQTKNQTQTTFDPGPLEKDMLYYWKIVAKDDHGNETTGPRWSFTAGTTQNQPPNPPWSPSPVHLATDVTTTPTLSWQATDPDGDALIFDVYFGIDPDPPLLTTDQSAATYDPGTLGYSTTYYWKIVVRDEHGATTTGAIWSFTTGTTPNQPPNAPSSPSPPNGATDVTNSTTLSWQATDPDGDALTYDVFFGTDVDPPIQTTDQSAATYDPVTLAYSTTYYWKIVVRDEHAATTTGSVWTFTTETAPNQPPNPPTSPSPSNGATDVTTTPTLAWQATDPDGDAMTYDVYFGTDVDPPLQTSDHATTTYDPGTLANSTTYYWKILARDEHGATTTGAIWSFTTGATPNQPPNAPTTPSPPNGTTDVTNTPTLSWQATDPDGDAMTYDVYFGTDVDPPLAASDHTTTGYPAGTLAYSTQYYWKIVVRDEHGATATGVVWTFTTEAEPNQPPNAPWNPFPPNGATDVANSTTLSWQATDPDGDNMIYDVYLGTDVDPPLAASDHTGTTYPAGTLAYSTQYYWKIAVRDEHGATTTGTVWSFTTEAEPNQPPNAPTTPSPSNGATGVTTTPTLGWQATDPNGDAMTYDVYFGTDGDPPLAASDHTTTTYPAGTLAYSTQYYWKIIVRDEHGATTTGTVWTFTTGTAPNQPPNAPTTPSPSNGATGVTTTPTLSWQATDPDGDNMTYDVYFGTGADPPLQATDHTTTSYPAGTLAYSTTYYWKIVVRDEHSAITTGTVWSFTTEAAPNQPPNAPTNPLPPNGVTGASTTPTLHWQATDPDGDNMTYDVYFGTGADPPLQATDHTITSYPAGTLAYSTQYYWKIVVRDEHGATTTGTVWSFTTEAEPNEPPNAPTNPIPPNGATGASRTPTLHWQATDPDGDNMTYDVYFGTGVDPPLQTTDHTTTSYPAGTLAYSTQYYWKIVVRDEHGATTTGTVWSFTTEAEPNQPPNAPTSPSPGNGATGVTRTPTLAWQASDPDGDNLTYDVYLGTDLDPPLQTTDYTSTTYPAGTLAYSTQYYWKIVVRDEHGATTSGTVWSFTTEAEPNQPPNAPTTPSPSNGATGVTRTPTLSWQASDPDGDNMTYDVYFGTDADPPFVVSDHTTTTYPTGTLAYSTQYYWKIVVRDEHGATTTGTVWSFTTEAEPNQPPTAPSNPNPPNGATGLSRTPTLQWQATDPDGDDMTYDVYLGTSVDPPLQTTDHTTTSYPVGTLAYSTTYYWKIVARDEHGATTTGAVWSFTTRDPPAEEFTVGVYADANGTDCNIVDSGPGLFDAYVVMKSTVNALAVEFSAPNPLCMNATYVSESSPYAVAIGDAENGVSIGFGACESSPNHVYTISYFGSGTTPSCCEYSVEPYPPTGNITLVECDGSTTHENGVGLTNTVNGDASCPCPVEDFTIGVYADVAGSECNIVDTGPGLVPVYCVVKSSEGAEAVQFKAPIPTCLANSGATYISDTAPFGVTIGNSQTGVAIGFGGCESPPIHVLTINYLMQGTTTACCLYPVLPDPAVPSGEIEWVQCGGGIRYGVGLTNTINGNAGCSCPVSAAR